MKISAKGRYAISFMLDLAAFNTGEPIPIKDIAKRQDIPEKFLEQIVSDMNRAGYVKSIRGAQGGYMLRYAPKEYSLDMILKLTEKNLVPNELDRKDLSQDKPGDGVVLRVHDKINHALNQVLKDITLEDMMELQQEDWSDYSI